MSTYSPKILTYKDDNYNTPEKWLQAAFDDQFEGEMILSEESKKQIRDMKGKQRKAFMKRVDPDTSFTLESIVDNLIGADNDGLETPDGQYWSFTELVEYLARIQRIKLQELAEG